MITGFFAFMIWALVFYFLSTYIFEKTKCKTRHQVLGGVAIGAFGLFLIWLYNFHWDWLAMGLFTLFFIYLAIVGLLGL